MGLENSGAMCHLEHDTFFFKAIMVHDNYKLSTRACMLEEKEHVIAPPRKCPAPSLFETQ